MGIKVDARLSVESVHSSTSDGFLVTSEAEHRQRHRNWYVDTNLSGLDLLLELRRSCTRTGKDCRSIAIFVRVYEGDGFIKSGNVEADKDRSKDLLGVAFHMWLDVCNYGGPDLETCQCLPRSS